MSLSNTLKQLATLNDEYEEKQKSLNAEREAKRAGLLGKIQDELSAKFKDALALIEKLGADERKAVAGDETLRAIIKLLGKKAAKTGGTRKPMSAEAKAKIAKAQKERWAKTRGEKGK